MSAYVLADVDVADPTAYATYRELAGESVAQHGGRYLVRGGEKTALEGEWPLSRVVVVEFPDVQSARRWYDSDVYRRAREARRGAAEMRAIVIEGAAAGAGSPQEATGGPR